MSRNLDRDAPRRARGRWDKLAVASVAPAPPAIAPLGLWQALMSALVASKPQSSQSNKFAIGDFVCLHINVEAWKLFAS